MESKRSQEVRPPVFSSLSEGDSIPQSPKISGEKLENSVEFFELRGLASNIRSVAQLRKIIKSADPKMRLEVFNLITPHITRFAVPSFRQLLGRSATRA